MTDSKNLVVAAVTPTGAHDETDIDRFELEASRRALLNLRTLLAGEKMQDLIRPQVEEADRRMHGYLAESHGEFTDTRVTMTIDGLHVQQLLPTLSTLMGGAASSDPTTRHEAEQKVFFAHPEHYCTPEGNGAGIIETMGGIPTRSRPAFVSPDDAPQFVTDLVDPSYDISMTGAASLEDGTIFTYVLQEYRDTERGMEVSLRIWYPRAAPAAYLEEHAKHYAVEFRNGVHLAASQASSTALA